LDGIERARVSRRLLLVSDAAFLLDSLRRCFQGVEDLVVMATAQSVSEAIAANASEHPDAILLDSALPAGVEAVTQILAASPDALVIALGLLETEDAVLPWAEAGISGYVPRSAGLAALIEAVRRVLRGEQTCPARVTGAMFRRLHQLAAMGRSRRGCDSGPKLTRREREVAALAADGLSNKLIARRLQIEVATAKCHVHHVLEKLHLQGRDDLARWMSRRQ